MPLLVPISVGELLDKIGILQLKAAAVADPAKRANVLHELALLDVVRQREVGPSPELDALCAALAAVNRELWEIEDDIRACERAGRFDAHFVALARGVYRANDRRAALKRQINELTGSDIVEEKSYR
ncbi:MAG TPA: DUF6165 family protein [Stellaceae bacterium]|nr:DUF6165 family protein [Stellaceae bacterium]